jgi:hypothetical protein
MKIGPQPRGGIAAPGVNLYDEPGFQTDGAPTNSLLSRSLNSLVSKNVVVSTGAAYLTSQEAIDNAFPAGVFRDTIALRGFQRGYQLAENSVTIDGVGGSFSPDQVVQIGAEGSTTAFSHALLGGNYAGNVTITSHNGGTANKLTLTDLIVSDGSALNFILSFAQASGLVDVVELVRVRGVKTAINGGTYGNGLVNFQGNTYEDHRPIRLNLLDCDLSSTIGPLFAGVAPRGTKIYLRGTTKVSGISATQLQRVRSADELGSTVAYTNDEILVDERDSGTPGTGGGTSGDVRDLGDVPTAKALAVIAAYQAEGGPVEETDPLYFGQEFIDDETDPGNEWWYVCRLRRPATGDPVRIWKWGRYLEAGV